MKSIMKLLLALTALVALAAPGASAGSFKHLFHHQPKTPLHPTYGSKKALKRQEKAKQKSAKKRQHLLDQHSTPETKQPM